MNPKLEVSGSRTRWPPSHVARPADQNLACYRLNQVGKSSLDPYKYPSANGIQDITLDLKFSTCKVSSLVVVTQAKPCRESRVESSLARAL
jgi:hypothetical protein